jgi:hypothetical protein
MKQHYSCQKTLLLINRETITNNLSKTLGSVITAGLLVGAFTDTTKAAGSTLCSTAI